MPVTPIAVCYFMAALLFLAYSVKTQALIATALLILYWVLMCLYPGANDLSPSGNFAAYVDRLLFSSVHLYGKSFDPEGILSTLPAISTALFGNLTAAWLFTNNPLNHKLYGLIGAGILSLLLGWLWGLSFPINKALWTSSYVLWTTGFALLTFAFSFWIIEIKQWTIGSKPFLVLGVNAMFAYVLHVFFLKLQAIIVFQKNRWHHRKFTSIPQWTFI